MQKISITWTISAEKQSTKKAIENQQVVMMEEENNFVWNSKNNDRDVKMSEREKITKKIFKVIAHIIMLTHMW